ncbi:MAG: NAD(P)/FAD-dependent oxidoreductase [Cytophagaceae bacterium]
MPSVVIIGGGASGFFTAIRLAELNPDISITILEKTSKTLSKVSISGGGRCNVTNGLVKEKEFLENYPRGKEFLVSAFKKFSNKDVIQWFKQHQVSLKTEKDLRVFPITDNSETIIQCYLHLVSKYKIQLQLNSEVVSISKKGSDFEIQLKNKPTILSNAVVLSCGGYMNSNSYDWLKSLSIPIVRNIPSLFTFNIPKSPLTDFMGVSAPNAIVLLPEFKLQYQGPTLITHWGISGPAVLKLSAFGALELFHCNYTTRVLINWLGINKSKVEELLKEVRTKEHKKSIRSFSPFEDISKRLWIYFCDCAGVSEWEKWAELGNKKLLILLQTLTEYSLEMRGKTTFKEEFVTSGGLDTNYFNNETMECKHHPGLFATGEILNIDGITGGFNFQACWSTGNAAAHGVINYLK